MFKLYYRMNDEREKRFLSVRIRRPRVSRINIHIIILKTGSNGNFFGKAHRKNMSYINKILISVFENK